MNMCCTVFIWVENCAYILYSEVNLGWESRRIHLSLETRYVTTVAAAWKRNDAMLK